MACPLAACTPVAVSHALLHADQPAMQASAAAAAAQTTHLPGELGAGAAAGAAAAALRPAGQLRLQLQGRLLLLVLHLVNAVAAHTLFIGGGGSSGLVPPTPGRNLAAALRPARCGCSTLRRSCGFGCRRGLTLCCAARCLCFLGCLFGCRRAAGRFAGSSLARSCCRRGIHVRCAAAHNCQGQGGHQAANADDAHGQALLYGPGRAGQHRRAMPARPTNECARRRLKRCMWHMLPTRPAPHCAQLRAHHARRPSRMAQTPPAPPAAASRHRVASTASPAAAAPPPLPPCPLLLYCVCPGMSERGLQRGAERDAEAKGGAGHRVSCWSRATRIPQRRSWGRCGRDWGARRSSPSFSGIDRVERPGRGGRGVREREARSLPTPTATCGHSPRSHPDLPANTLSGMLSDACRDGSPRGVGPKPPSQDGCCAQLGPTLRQARGLRKPESLAGAAFRLWPLPPAPAWLPLAAAPPLSAGGPPLVPRSAACRHARQAQHGIPNRPATWIGRGEVGGGWASGLPPHRCPCACSRLDHALCRVPRSSYCQQSEQGECTSQEKARKRPGLRDSARCPRAARGRPRVAAGQGVKRKQGMGSGAARNSCQGKCWQGKYQEDGAAKCGMHGTYTRS